MVEQWNNIYETVLTGPNEINCEAANIEKKITNLNQNNIIQWHSV